MLQMSPASPPMSRRILPAVAAVLLVVALAACGGDLMTDPSSVRAPRRLLRGDELAAVQLVSCPTASTELDALGVVSFWGGEIEGNATSVYVPVAAVDETTGIAVNVPASEYLEVQFNANGGEHYTFDRPITVTIDYSRCADSSIRSHAALRVVYVDDVTKQPIEDMGGVVDSVARTITFQTGHFSSYVVSE
jgi:hypothetical protein